MDVDTRKLLEKASDLLECVFNLLKVAGLPGTETEALCEALRRRLHIDWVLITQEEFDALPEYSCSVPTGTTIGKRWKRCEPYGGAQRGVPHEWWIGEYVPSDIPGRVGITWNRIFIS